MKPFVVDKFCIHLRSFLCLTSAFYHSSNWPIIVLSAIFHTSSFIQLIDYLYELRGEDTPVIYDPKSERCNAFLQATNLFVCIPVIMDVVFVALCLSTSDYTSSIHLLSSTLVCIILSIISSFYEMTHVAFHGLLILQTAYLSNCVIEHNHRL